MLTKVLETFFLLFGVFNNMVHCQAQHSNLIEMPMQVSGDSGVTPVTIHFFYESLCPFCIRFYATEFLPTVKLLAPYLNIYTYPYGNVKTLILPTGSVLYMCQHGPAECYGNMLHACAIEHLDIKDAVLYNACLMAMGSNDKAATLCSARVKTDPTVIKACAKGRQGRLLLQYYGEQSKNTNYTYVPYVLVNGEPLSPGDSLITMICNAFEVSPPECTAN